MKIPITTKNISVKVVYNNCYGGCSLSERATEMLNDIKGYKKGDRLWISPKYGYFSCPRHDADLVKVVETLGKEASGVHSKLVVETITSPLYMLEEYDGIETIYTPNNIDWTVVDTPEVAEKYPEFFL